MATGSDQCSQQVAIFRTRCQTLQLQVYTQLDSLTRTRCELYSDRAAALAAMPWVSESSFPREVRGRIAQFSAPLFVPFFAYAQVERADNDPVLPHHHQHWLAGAVRPQGHDEFPIVPEHEVVRLKTRVRSFERELQALRRDGVDLAQHAAFWRQTRNSWFASIGVVPGGPLDGGA